MSLKTVDTNGNSWKVDMADHINDLSNRSITVNGVEANRALDVRVQPGGLTDANQWANSMRDSYPNVTIVVSEFAQP